MRVGHLVPARFEWYDRNPTSLLLLFQQTGGPPNGGITRWTYTVPSGRKAWLSAAVVSYSCLVEPTTAAIARAEIVLNDGVSSGLLARAWLYTGTKGARSDQSINGTWMIPAGMSILGGDTSIAVGGDWEIVESALVTEFDA